MEHGGAAMTTITTPAAAPTRQQFRLRDIPARIRPADPVKVRLAALRRFAVAITAFTVAGHLFLGFEQSVAQPVTAVLVCYVTDLVLETVVAFRDARRPKFLPESPGVTSREQVTAFVNFLLPAHITGFALGMLLFMNNRLDLFVVAAVVAVSSKYVFRVRTDRGPRHFFNPSNFGITVLLLAYSDTVSIAPPYQFTERLDSTGSVILPMALACAGFFMNWIFTGKLPLIAAWVAGFALQGLIRSLLFDHISFAASVAPLTGVAVLLFTLYMVTDPGSTPQSTRGQVVFGGSVAAVYGILVSLHVVFGVFFALTIVCTCRGLGIAVLNAVAATRASTKRAGATQPVGSSPVPVERIAAPALHVATTSSAATRHEQDATN